jgi:hypothetical protein
MNFEMFPYLARLWISDRMHFHGDPYGGKIIYKIAAISDACVTIIFSNMAGMMQKQES